MQKIFFPVSGHPECYFEQNRFIISTMRFFLDYFNFWNDNCTLMINCLMKRVLMEKILAEKIDLTLNHLIGNIVNET